VPSVAETTATDVIIIDNDHDTDNIVAWQECITDIKQEPVDTDVVNVTIAEPEPVIQGTFHNNVGTLPNGYLKGALLPKVNPILS
jgi:hypothetical protein